MQVQSGWQKTARYATHISSFLTCSRLSSWHCFWSRSLRNFSTCCSNCPRCCCALVDRSSFQSADVHFCRSPTFDNCNMISVMSLSLQSNGSRGGLSLPCKDYVGGVDESHLPAPPSLSLFFLSENQLTHTSSTF